MKTTKVLLFLACLGCAARAAALVDQKKINDYRAAMQQVRMSENFLKWAQEQYDLALLEMKYGHGSMPYEEADHKKKGETRLKEDEARRAQLWEGLNIDERVAIAQSEDRTAASQPVLPPPPVMVTRLPEVTSSAHSFEEQSMIQDEIDRMERDLLEFNLVMQDPFKPLAEKQKLLRDVLMQGPQVYQHALKEHRDTYDQFVKAAKQQIASEQQIALEQGRPVPTRHMRADDAAQRIQDAWKRHVDQQLEQKADRMAQLAADEAYAKQLEETEAQIQADAELARQLQAEEEAAIRR